MRVSEIPSGWLQSGGRRLDCGPYTSGAIELRQRLNGHECKRLIEMCAGPKGGIFRPPIFGMKFAQNVVYSPEYGVPFLTSSSMLHADISNLPLISRKMATSKKFAILKLNPGMTLISCSGAIGRTVYVREDMAGIWSSQAVMKVQPDPSLVRPGFIFAFLSSRYGRVLSQSSTYGALVPQIEREHLVDLPVPRLGPEVEENAHALVEEAAALLSSYQQGIVTATNKFFEVVGLTDIHADEWHREGPDTGFATTFPRQTTFRALNYNPRSAKLCERIRSGRWRGLGSICVPETLKRGGRFKRIDADPEHAYQLVGQKQLFWLRPEGRWVSRAGVPADLLVQPGVILMAAQGGLQESSSLGDAAFVTDVQSKEYIYSEHLLRVQADESMMLAGCLFAFLRSNTAKRILRSTAVGSMLQGFHPELLNDVPVPIPDLKDQQPVASLVETSLSSRERGIRLELEAIALVERAIEEAS